MRFPVVIRHRGEKAKIYGKSDAYPFYRVAYRAAGKRHVKSFKTYAEAKEAAEQAVRDLATGSQAAGLTSGQAADALTALEMLEGFRRDTGRTATLKGAVGAYIEAAKRLNGHSIAQAVDGFLSTVAPVKRKPVAEAVAEFCKERETKAKSIDGKRPQLSPVYVAETARLLGEFVQAVPGYDVSGLTKETLKAFMAAGDRAKLSPKSRNHYRATLRTFLGWCETQDYLPTTHRLYKAEAMQKEKANDSETEFYRVSEFQALLEGASDTMRAVIAIQGLAGLRLDEVLRLKWEKVFGIHGHIEIDAGVAKTRSRRLVEICPALEAWLAPYRQLSGKVTDQTLDAYTWQFIQLRKRLKIPSRKNGLRHAFCTYHFALHSNENLTAAQAGNSPAMIHGHYKGLATKAEAGKWFATMPATPGNVIQIGRATA